MRHDETEQLPPTQRRKRNVWDFLAESVRVVGRFATSPGGILLLILGAIALGWINADTLNKVADAVGGLMDRVR